MDNYEDFVVESAEMQANLESLFGSRSDWLGIADVFMNLSEADKSEPLGRDYAGKWIL